MPQGRLLFSAFAVACLTITANVVWADNWPRFRGPNGSGNADDHNIPVTWTDKNFLWKIDLPGPGNSSPIVWNGRLFIQCSSKDGKERMLLCLDAKDGSTQWVRKVPGKASKMHKLNTLASASPGVDAERVYAVFWDGSKQIMNAYTHQGEQLWSRDFGTFTSEHGAGASPIPVGDKVCFNNDQDTKAELFCLDGKTGKTVWMANRPFHKACYSSPVMRTFQDGRKPELVVCTTKGITGYDADTGTQHWNWEWDFKTKTLMRTVASPIYANGIIYANSGDNPKGPRHMVAVRPGDNSPQLVWENLKDFGYMSTIVAHGKCIYCVNDQGMMGCYDAETGKRAWYERLDEGSFSSSPIVVDGKLYVASDYGDMYVVAADPTSFQVLAKNHIGEVVRATPAVSDEKMFIRGDKHLFCVGK